MAGYGLSVQHCGGVSWLNQHAAATSLIIIVPQCPLLCDLNRFHITIQQWSGLLQIAGHLSRLAAAGPSSAALTPAC